MGDIYNAKELKEYTFLKITRGWYISCKGTKIRSLKYNQMGDIIFI